MDFESCIRGHKQVNKLMLTPNDVQPQSIDRKVSISGGNVGNWTTFGGEHLSISKTGVDSNMGLENYKSMAFSKGH